MFKNADKGQLLESQNMERWKTSVVIESEYRDKWNRITTYYNNRLEKAPALADVFRNAINHIYMEIKNGSIDN